MIAWLSLTTILAQAPMNDIDAFMERVLEKRDVNWEDYYNYFCTERVQLTVEGALSSVPIQGVRGEFLWFVRDGYLVRSPVEVDGVRISPEEREEKELEWIERLEKREAERGADRERFFGFQFEPGNYFYAGRREFEGREVVVIEYYPEKSLFGEADEDQVDSEIEAKFNKAFFVTLLVDPDEHQIVRMTLDNTGFDFLPGGWLFKIDTVEMSLTMHEPFEGVWLARDIEGRARVTTANGDLGVDFASRFSNCVKAQTTTKYRFPPRGNSRKKK